jgi:hypothetical protein
LNIYFESIGIECFDYWYFSCIQRKNEIHLPRHCKSQSQYKHIIKDSSNDYNKNLILNKIKNLNGNNKIYLHKFLKQNENEMEYYLSHPDRNVKTYFNKIQTE